MRDGWRPSIWRPLWASTDGPRQGEKHANGERCRQHESFAVNQRSIAWRDVMIARFSPYLCYNLPARGHYSKGKGIYGGQYRTPSSATRCALIVVWVYHQSGGHSSRYYRALLAVVGLACPVRPVQVVA